MPLLKCDVGIQWILQTTTTVHRQVMTDSETQTDPATSVSAFDLDDKDSKFFTCIRIGSFWQILYALMAFFPTANNQVCSPQTAVLCPNEAPSWFDAHRFK